MRFLFVKARLEWPRTYGHDVHCYEMMRALAGLGHEVALATDVQPSSQAITGLTLSAQWVLEEAPATTRPVLSYFQERYRSYWGISVGRIAHLGRLSSEWRADAVVVVGLEILPYLAGPKGPVRIWYAADEWVWHYVSQMAAAPSEFVGHLKQAVIKGLYERAYGPVMDRVWVVSDSDRRAMRLVAGCRHIDVLPNGVDAAAFVSTDEVPARHSAVFWGRLGFGPNIQSLDWFVLRVWPLVRAKVPQATFSILGADPPPEVSAYNGRNGIRVVPNLPDLRPEISRAEVVVLPFVSGGGIKNKFLEAASMSRPIVATSRATRGLRSAPPARIGDTPDAFAGHLIELWNSTDARAELGHRAREWVERTHTWKAAAAEALAGLDRVPGRLPAAAEES
jgi:polysaccharide biosynthesis protein PslH